MKFVDEATIEIVAGDGGNGAASFRHEKYKEFGGPHGGARRAAALGRQPSSDRTLEGSGAAPRASTLSR